MNLSILHVSDLHRDSNNPIRNDVLLDSLENDRRHFSVEEEPKIRVPDLIVVSGDVIQGVSPDAPEPEESLRAQYEQASGFLGQLADRFVGGDRERVVIVPGNHDVSAYHFASSLEPVDIPAGRQKRELIAQLFQHGSPLRWSWRDLKLYTIRDRAMYRARMAAFADFYSEFYQGERKYSLNPAKQLDVFDFPEFDLTIVGFSSCHNNDLHNKQGAMHPGCIAEAGNRLRHPSASSRLRMAVWHHNTEGPPIRADYMDPDFIQNLIDRGFTLGLHGHQHRPQYLDTKFRHGIERKITVISAGTLCGGVGFGQGRAYNVIELDTVARTGRLHVRGMQNDNLSLPIWGRRSLPPNTYPYYEFGYDPPPPPSSSIDETTTILIQAQDLHLRGLYREAADLLIAVMPAEELARHLLLDCLVRIGDTGTLLQLFDPPTTDAEAIHVMDALWSDGQEARLLEIIECPPIVDSLDPSVVEIRRKYKARLQ